MKNKGFTLVEIAIALLIIALISTVLITSRDMSRTAGLNSVIDDVEKYTAAIRLFEAKYLSLPGDMTDATSYWATSANGNGDGQIFDWNTESLRAWQQLALSGIIEGNYTGALDGAKITIGKNVPASKIDGGGYLFFYSNVSSVNVRTDNHLRFGAENGGSLWGAVINSVDAHYIDEKRDDGLAETGSVRTMNGTGVTGCIVNPGVDDSYILTNTSNTCRMFFFLEAEGG